MTINSASYDLIRSDDEFVSVNFGPNWLNELCEIRGGSKDCVDPIDLLPADPFGMELGSNLAAAIAGWIEDLNVNSTDSDFYHWNNHYLKDLECLFCPYIGFESVGFNPVLSFEKIVLNDGFFECEVHSCIVNHGKDSSASSHMNDLIGEKEEDKESIPHDGLILSLAYLGVQDLLSVDRVCKSLHFAVQNDPLLWRCIHIDSPLSEKINDDALQRLCSKAQGSLECLSLNGCWRITDDGLRKVLDSNPKLQKLSVAGCLRLTMDGLVQTLKTFKTTAITGIKTLKIGRLFSISSDHYKALQSLLGEGNRNTSTPHTPRFYHFDISSIACENDGRALDIELCEGCQKYKLVFDCPSEICQRKGVEQCKACDMCIERCVHCGKCVKGRRFVENFFMDYLCSDCWKQASICGEE